MGSFDNRKKIGNKKSVYCILKTSNETFVYWATKSPRTRMNIFFQFLHVINYCFICSIFYIKLDIM